MTRRAAVAVLALACAEAACTEAPSTEPQPVGPCGAVVEEVPDELGEHVPIGTPIEWSSTPPATGTHYWTWAAWDRDYAEVVPPGFWLHNAEHGGVILLHRGDPSTRAALVGLTDDLPLDPRCAAPVRHRTLVTPAELPPGVAVALIAWNWRYTARCFDAATARAFIDARYSMGSESTCAEGLYPDALDSDAP